MAKSTVDDLLAAYRVAGKLSKGHRSKLVELLTHDVREPVRPERKKKREQKPDEDGAL